MNCPECDKEIVVRNGKFGEFLCCPTGKHGTFSIQSGTMYFTGELGQMLKNKRIQEFISLQRLQYIDSGVAFQPSFIQQINQQLAYFGWNATGEVEQLAEFAVGEAKHATLDDDHWSNTRMY